MFGGALPLSFSDSQATYVIASGEKSKFGSIACDPEAWQWMAWVDGLLRTTLAPHLTSDVLGWDHRAQLRTGHLSARLRGWFSRPWRYPPTKLPPNCGALDPDFHLKF